MKTIKLLNKISPVGLQKFDSTKYTLSSACEAPDAILVRSAAMHDMVFDENLRAIARCGAGVNNIPVEECAARGIVVFNTPGANANGVKELTIAALLLASRDIIGGVQWASGLTQDVAKAVEAGKSAFAGCELAGKTLGVIGLGAIGGAVANAAQSLGMNVIGYDPHITVEAAWRLSRSVHQANSCEEVFRAADYLTLHVPATKETKGMIHAGTIAQMKPSVRIVNLARADLVCVADIRDAIANGHIARYVTDFPTEETVGQPGILTIPHLGASTEESEDNCAVMAAEELMDYLENGNIRNSVNYPSISMPGTESVRLTILHRNIPNMISHITTPLASAGINIENMANRSKGEYACTMIGTNTDVSDALLETIRAVDGIIRVIKL